MCFDARCICLMMKSQGMKPQGGPKLPPSPPKIAATPKLSQDSPKVHAQRSKVQGPKGGRLGPKGFAATRTQETCIHLAALSELLSTSQSLAVSIEHKTTGGAGSMKSGPLKTHGLVRRTRIHTHTRTHTHTHEQTKNVRAWRVCRRVRLRLLLGLLGAHLPLGLVAVTPAEPPPPLTGGHAEQLAAVRSFARLLARLLSLARSLDDPLACLFVCLLAFLFLIHWVVRWFVWVIGVLTR